MKELTRPKILKRLEKLNDKTIDIAHPFRLGEVDVNEKSYVGVLTEVKKVIDDEIRYMKNRHRPRRKPSKWRRIIL